MKQEWAVKNGYTVIRVCQESIWHKKLLKDEVFKHIKTYDTPVVIVVAPLNKLSQYKSHI